MFSLSHAQLHTGRLEVFLVGSDRNSNPDGAKSAENRSENYVNAVCEILSPRRP